MGKRRGNPAWYRGMPSANPYGRPIGQTSLGAFCQDPTSFRVWFYRWERFCWGLVEPPYTGAAAARKAGYSPKSARFIASRLLKKPIIREILRKQREMVDATRKLDKGVWLIPDYSGKYRIYRNKKYR
ncbi:terminase small subunit [Chloroflexota bacterium]